MKPPPPDWGNDELTKYLEVAQQNRWATFHNMQPACQRLIDIDAAFFKITQQWTNPSSSVAAHLVIRTLAAFRTACAHAMAGEIPDCFAAQRAALEAASYALLISKNSDLEDIWLSRHDSEEALREVKKKFAFGRLKEAVAAANRSTAPIFEEIYDRAIDFGGHPNERSILAAMQITEREGGTHFEQLLSGGDDLSLRHALKTTAQAGVCALEVLQGCFNARFEILGINATLPGLRAGL